LPKPACHVLVCTNTRPPGNPKGSCGEKGADALVDAWKALVREQGLDERVMVNRTSCLKHCSRGVAVAVYPDGTWYGGVRAEDLAELHQAQVVEGRPLERLRMPDLPWE
jgi:(2Fe-2S) ferredoxin